MGFFGKKGAAAVEELDEAPKGAAKPASGSAKAPSKKVWGVLFVLSIVLMAVFGCSVAALVYMKMSTPPLAQVPAHASGKVKKIPPPKGEDKKAEPPKTETAKAEPPKAEERKPEAKPEPKVEAKPAAVAKAAETKPSDRPTGSPAVHAAALPKHTAEPITASAKTEHPAAKPAPAAPKQAPAAPAAGEKHVRAVVVEFTHAAPSAKEVLLRGPFLVRTGGKKAMVKDSSGTWRLSLSLLPGTYKYSFVVDGKRGPGESRVVQ